MRGSQLFTNLFSETEASAYLTKVVRGRDINLCARRDELLIYRYYYYGSHTDYRYEKIMERLETEFFLSQRRIQNIISEYAARLRVIRNEGPSVQDLRKRWAHLQW